MKCFLNLFLKISNSEKGWYFIKKILYKNHMTKLSYTYKYITYINRFKLL